MAQMNRILFLRHLRAEPSRHVLHYRGGRLCRSGRGLAYWFVPLSASVAEVPCDDRDLPFLFHARSADFQDVTVQGVITYRVVDPEALAGRVDFSIDLRGGRYREQPLEQLAELLTNMAQQTAWEYLAADSVRALLAAGVDPVRRRVLDAFEGNSSLAAMGLEVVALSVSSIAPSSEMEKALRTPALESIQQGADEAVFERRALAVEKERAIAENELANQVELAIREEQLIGQRGLNDQRRATEEAEARRIETQSTAERAGVEAGGRAESIRAVEEARVASERERMDIYRSLPPHVLMGLAAQEFAGKLQRIEHFNLAPDMIGPLFSDLIRAGTGLLAQSRGAEPEAGAVAVTATAEESGE